MAAPAPNNNSSTPNNSSGGGGDSDCDETLRAEIERLNRELDQASSEKIQSAQYGLVLLDEKSHLQLKCDELETLYENTKHELDITQEVSDSILYLFILP